IIGVSVWSINLLRNAAFANGSLHKTAVSVFLFKYFLASEIPINEL
ncbi:hypothetical protein LCGC14_2876030, partial [marine sediment metagenome]